jgi:hypothetical protein
MCYKNTNNNKEKSHMYSELFDDWVLFFYLFFMTIRELFSFFKNATPLDPSNSEGKVQSNTRLNLLPLGLLLKRNLLKEEKCQSGYPPVPFSFFFQFVDCNSLCVGCVLLG